MFDQTFVDTHAHTRKSWTVAVSFSLQIALIAIALIVPLLRIATLDLPVKIPVWLPLEKLDLMVKPEATAAASTVRPVFRMTALRFPIAVPRQIDMTPDAPAMPAGEAVPVLPGFSFSTLSAGIAIQPPLARTPAADPRLAPPSAPLHIGGSVQSASLIFGPRPAYPRLAIATRTQGIVKIQALIGRDGAIRNLRVLSGPSLLIASAMDAVRQWRYRPTLLNGNPVEVVTEIDVNFTMDK